MVICSCVRVTKTPAVLPLASFLALHRHKTTKICWKLLKKQGETNKRRLFITQKHIHTHTHIYIYIYIFMYIYKGWLKSSKADQYNLLECNRIRFIFQHCSICCPHTFFHQCCSGWIPLVQNVIYSRYNFII